MVSSSSGGNNDHTVFIGNLSNEINQKRLREIFQNIGDVREIRITTDPETGLKRGFGFCELANKTQVYAAVNSLDGQQLAGRRLKVDVAEGTKGSEMDANDGQGARISAKSKKAIEDALGKLTTSEIYDVVSEMKVLIQRDPDHALELLKSKPILAQAMLTAQLMLGMAQMNAEIEDSSRNYSDRNDY